MAKIKRKEKKITMEQVELSFIVCRNEKMVQ